MKIVHLSTWDNFGGAAVAAYRLHNSLLCSGVDSKMFVKNRIENTPSVIRYNPKKNSYAHKFFTTIAGNKHLKEYNQYKNKPADVEYFSGPNVPDTLGPIRQMPDGDIYHLHWISNFIDIPSLFNFLKKNNKSVVWTLHDMNPFTGGCHHDDGCGKHDNKCGRCPQLNSDDENDISNRYFRIKKKAYTLVPPEKIFIAPDSHWLAEQAKKSKLLDNLTIQTVHYGIDTDLLRPVDKFAAKSVLGIDEKFFVILFGAANISNRRKGFHLLLESISLLSHKYQNIFLLTYGSNPPPIGFDLNYKHLGNISNPYFARIINSAADLFVIPSVREAFGQTCLEAMCCGTPAIGFKDAGGIADMINNGLTGFLADEMNPQSLAIQIEKVISQEKDNYLQMSANCRELAVYEYRLDIQAKRYIGIYQNLLK